MRPAAGYLIFIRLLTGFPSGSNLNFGPGETIANLVMTRLPPNGYVELYNELGTVDIIGDATGYYA